MKKITIFLVLLIAGITGFSQKKLPAKMTADQYLNNLYCTGLFKSADGVYFDLLDNNTASGYFNILDWLQGRVAGLRVISDRSGNRIPYIRNQRATIYLDEIMMSIDFGNIINVSDIAMIKVIKSPFIGGFGSGGGAIAIYTKGGEEEE